MPYESSPTRPFRNAPVEQCCDIAAPKERRGLIECELSDLQNAAQELEEVVARLLSRMSPAMSPDCPKPDKNPSGPEPCLPDLGNAIRNVRTTVNRTIAEVRSAIERVEL